MFLIYVYLQPLYSKPTIWNSHCFAAFTEEGKELYKALQDEEISKIAWEKYGFRTGITGGTYDVSNTGLAIPKSITSTVSSLKMDYYNKLIEYLSNQEEYYGSCFRIKSRK